MGNDISLSQAQQELVDWVENGDSCSLASAIVLGSNFFALIPIKYLSPDEFFFSNESELLRLPYYRIRQTIAQPTRLDE